MALPASRHDDQADADHDALIARYVETAPAYPTPDEARLGDYGVSVTALITELQAVDGDVAAVARAYRVPGEAVLAAIAYYERHKKMIDARITLNVARFTGEGRTHSETIIPFFTLPSEPDTGRRKPDTVETRLIARHVETAPAYPTADVARLSDYGVSVTAIIMDLQGVDWNIEETARSYRIPAEAVLAAIAYYERHKAVIDARITLNVARFTGEGRP